VANVATVAEVVMVDMTGGESGNEDVVGIVVTYDSLYSARIGLKKP